MKKHLKTYSKIPVLFFYNYTKKNRLLDRRCVVSRELLYVNHVLSRLSTRVYFVHTVHQQSEPSPSGKSMNRQHLS